MCVKYWPDEKGQHRQYGRISVMLDSEQTPHADYVSRKLKIWLDDKKDASRSVTQFHFHQWPEGSCPSNASSIVELINDLQRVQRQSGNNPVTVHCSDGVGRTGTFCALLTALDRVKTEQIVDVFRTVKSLRIQRSGMCSTVVSFSSTVIRGSTYLYTVKPLILTSIIFSVLLYTYELLVSIKFNVLL